MILAGMPRKARIDNPGALHHIMARGIEGRPIFQNDYDRKDFLNRLALLLEETETKCFAWALIPNHFHLLLKTGIAPVAKVMLRLLTGYAVSYNLRHKRRGHLFQNRYKSILCQEDPYFLELVRYIHLNPIRANLAPDLKSLEKYPYCGHGTLTGKSHNTWQDAEGVLRLFGKNITQARRQYKDFVLKGIDQGRREDLTGGGLVRSVGGWKNVKALRKAKLWQKSDERILGDGDFVKQTLASSQESLEQKYSLQARGYDLAKVADRVCELLDVKRSDIWAPGKERYRVQARSLLCFWASRELRISQSELSRKFKLSPTTISLCVKRGEEIVRDNGYFLFDKKL
jgi:REP element-mobilizing transposase RayT